MRQLIAPCLLMALTLAACSATDTAMTTDSSRNTGPKSEVDLRPKYNPHPTKARVITLTIDNAPGPFGRIQGYAQYDVINDAQCGKPNLSTGTRMRITASESFELRRVSDTEYTGTFHEDLMMDEDYYGAGVCRWEFTEVRAVLSATGGDDETSFVAALSKAAIDGSSTATRYFWSKGYPKEKGLDRYSDGGFDSAEKYRPELRDQLFSTTLKTTTGR